MPITIQVGSSFGLSGQLLEDDEATPISLAGRSIKAELLQDALVLEQEGELIADGLDGRFSFEFTPDSTIQLRKLWLTQLRMSAPMIGDPSDVMALGICEVSAE